MLGHELTTQFPSGAIGLDEARAAVDRSRELVESTQLAHQIVETQAVAALARQGLTVRQIARHLNLSKSHVGRQVANLDTSPAGWAVRATAHDALQRLVHEIWTDPASSGGQTEANP